MNITSVCRMSVLDKFAWTPKTPVAEKLVREHVACPYAIEFGECNKEECSYSHACRGDHGVCQRKAEQVSYRLLANGQCNFDQNDCVYSHKAYLRWTPAERELLKPWAYKAYNYAEDKKAKEFTI